MINRSTYNTYGYITANKNLIEHTTLPPSATQIFDDISLQNLVNVVESIFKNNKLTISDASIGTLNATNLTVTGTSTMGDISSTKGSFDELCLNNNCIKTTDKVPILYSTSDTTDKPPSYYITNYPSQVIRELKSEVSVYDSIIKNVLLETSIFPNAKTVIQKLDPFNGNISYTRINTSNTDTWGPWSGTNLITKIRVRQGAKYFQIFNLYVNLHDMTKADMKKWTAKSNKDAGSSTNASKAIDDNRTTYFSSHTDESNNWLEIEFNKTVPIREIIIYYRYEPPYRQNNQFSKDPFPYVRKAAVQGRMSGVIIECFNGGLLIRTLKGTNNIDNLSSKFVFY